MQGCKHYAAGEDLLRQAHEAQAKGHFGRVISLTSLATAEFTAATAAGTLAGRYGDPTRDANPVAPYQVVGPDGAVLQGPMAS